MDVIREILNFIAGVFADSMAGSAADAMLDKVKPDAVKRAYKRALKKWTADKRLRRMYADMRIDTIEKLGGYIKNGCDMGSGDVEDLCRLLYDELKNDESTCRMIGLMNAEACNVRLAGIESRQDDMLLRQEHLYGMTERIAGGVEAVRGVSRFEKPEGYIPRTCSVMADDGCMTDRFVHPERYMPFSLPEFVAGVAVADGKRCILFAGAQAGKTTELYNLAYELQHDGLFRPLLYEVRDYADLPGLLPKLTDDMQRKTVLLIDALDERFDGSARNSLFNDINGYAKDYPHLRIILSCRSNFKGEIMLDGFVRMSLNDLSMDQAEAFLRDRDAMGLLECIEKDSLYEFTRVPFFLSSLVDFYKDKGSVPSDRNVLYEFVINRRLLCEERKSLEYKYDMRHEGRKLLGRLATGMMLVGANAMAEEDIVSMLGCDDRGWSILLHSGMLELSSDRYRFVHNSFKEYFVADVMCEKAAYDDIKMMCCYPGTNIIRDTWHNTLALYISRIRSHDALFGEMISWISADNMELVLFMEKRTMDMKMRSDIFVRMLEVYNGRYMRIAEGSDYTYRRLMDFGFSTASAEFLLAGLKEVKEIDTPAINLLWCAKFIDWDMLYGNDVLAASLRDVLYGLLGSFLDVQDRVFYAMLPFENKAFLNGRGISRMFDIVKDSDGAEAVSVFISFVNMAGLADRYIDYIISHDDCVNDYNYNGIQYHVGRDDLYKAYKAVLQKDSLLKVLSRITVLLRKNTGMRRYGRNDVIEVLGVVLDKLAAGWGADSGVAKAVTDAMLGCDEHFFACDIADAVDLFVEYFRKTGLETECFKTLYGQLENAVKDGSDKAGREMRYALACCAARMLSEEHVEFVSDRFGRNTAEGASMLYWLRDYASEDMRYMIDVRLRNVFPNYVRADYMELEARRERAELDVLFDYDEFRRQVIGVMNGRQVISDTDIRQLCKVGRMFSDEEEEKLNRFVLFFFHHVFNGCNELDLHSVEQAIDDADKYREFLLHHVFRYMYPADNERVMLSDAQRAFIAEIAVDLLRRLSGGCAVDGEAASAALKMLLHGGLAIDSELAFGLMPWADFVIYVKDDGFYGHEYSVLDYIEKRGDIPVDDIKCFIYDEIDRDGWSRSLRRRSLFSVFFCRNRLSGGCSRAFNYIKECDDDDFGWMNMIGIMMEHEYSGCFVLDRVYDLSPQKRLYVWDNGTVFKDIMYRGAILCDVEDNMSEYGGSDIDKALRLLLRLGSVAGIKYLDEHLYDSRIRDENFIYGNTDVEILPVLMNMFVRVCQDDRGFDPFLSSLTDVIGNVAVASEEGFCAAETAFKDLMTADSKFVYLNFHIERWRKKRLEAGLGVWTVRRAKDFMDGWK